MPDGSSYRSADRFYLRVYASTLISATSAATVSGSRIVGGWYFDVMGDELVPMQADTLDQHIMRVHCGRLGSMAATTGLSA